MPTEQNAAEQLGDAYRTLREDSTFEFTVESVGVLDGCAIAFGLVTKGVLYEGYQLRLVRQDAEEKVCVCRAIAGPSKRLAQADSQSTNRNIGIWLDIVPSEVRRKDRLISFDTSASARQITPADFEFSLLHGVRK